MMIKQNPTRKPYKQCQMEQTNYFRKCKRTTTKTVDNITKQIETLTTTMLNRDQKRDINQQRREKEREEELDIREANQHN